MKAIALLAIRLYQRFISPQKGFSCAYRAATGRAGCSGLGYRAIRRYGAWRGWLILRRRLEKCGDARRKLLARHSLKSAQAGFCDVGDVCSGADTACNIADCACDLGDIFNRGEEAARKNRALFWLLVVILCIAIAAVIFAIME